MPEIAKLLEKKYPKYWDQSANVSGIRTRTLSFLLLAYCGLGISLCVVHFLGDRIPLMQIVLVFSAVALIGVLMLRAGINMKYVGHYAMVGLTVAILTNTLIYGKANHTTTIQFIFVLLSASFYLLGARWGLIYSIINVALTGAIMFTRQCTPFSIPANTYDVDSTTYYFSLSYNYATLLYIHFRFFKDSEWANLKEKTLVEELRTTAAEAHGIADCFGS